MAAHRNAPSEEAAVRPEERKWSREVADRHVMRDQVAEVSTGEPSMQVKGRRLDLERGRQAFFKVEDDRMVRCRADRREASGELRHRRTVDVAGSYQTRAWMPPQNVAERLGVSQVLHVHVPDAGDEGRMVQKDQRRPR